ncbi:MAG: hypothetical protein ACK4XK_06160 [Casimicrobiaceae bacterium]
MHEVRRRVMRPIRQGLAKAACAVLAGCLSAWASQHALAQASACPFNVSGQPAASATVDGVLLHRYALGLRGSALVTGFPSLDSSAVEATIAAERDRLDINGNGLIDRDDAAAIARYAFGFPPERWAQVHASPKNYDADPAVRRQIEALNLASNFAVRHDEQAIRAFIEAGCPRFDFTPPTAEQAAAARFLIRTTFGPTRAQIAALASGPTDPTVPGPVMKQRFSRWINDQFATPRPC